MVKRAGEPELLECVTHQYVLKTQMQPIEVDEYYGKALDKQLQGHSMDINNKKFQDNEMRRLADLRLQLLLVVSP